MSVFELERLDSGSLKELRRCAGHSSEADPLEVSLRLHDPPEPYLSAVFAGALMADLGHIPLRISHEPDEALLANVFRSGLAAALGSRGGPTSFVDPGSPLNDAGLGATWTPGMSAFRAAMFSPGPDADAGLFGPSHAVFLNPHRTTTPPGPSSITRIVRRWLGTRLTGEGAPERIADVGFALDQLVVNVTEHAVTDATPSVSSLARIEIESGPDGEPASLHFAVLDTGAGIANTLRAKLADPPANLDLLPALLQGQLAQWGRARGIGLSRLTQLVQEASGSMFLAVEGTSVSVEAGAVTALADVSAAAGSVISLRLPLLG
jgi:hypothetical protein